MPEKDTPTYPWFMERRYLTLIIILVFVILSAVTFTICYRHHAIYTEQTLKEDRAIANLLSLVLEERLKKLVGVMESYVQRPLLLKAVRDRNAEKATEHLINLAKSNPDIDIVVISDRWGTPWASYPAHSPVLGKNFAHRDWHKGVSKEWKSNISDVVLRVVGEKDLAVQISIPFIDEIGEVIGILVNTQRTVVLSNLIQQAPLDYGTFITVNDRKGQIVYSSEHEVKEIKPSPFHAGMKKAMAAKNKTFAVDDPDLGGRTRYISFAPIVNVGWTVFVERDKRSIFLSESAYYIQVTAVAFFLFLSIILALVYSRKKIIAQHILEQLQAEKKIRVSDQRYKSYIDVTMQIGWTTNDKGELVEDNLSWSKYTGRGYEEIKGFGWMNDMHPDDREHTEQIWGKAVAEKSFYEIEYRLRRYDGVYRNYLARGIPLLDEEGSVREWIGTCIDITDRKRAEEKLKDTLESLRRAVNTTIQVMVSAVEVRDPYTSGHQIRSADLARAIAVEMGLPQDKIEAIRMASPIHDIGKLSIPAEILAKPTKLSEIELLLIKQHAQKGYEMLKDVESPWPLAEIVHQHHERMDGSGYPRNLKGEEILIEARILAVADVVEAMASHRPYRAGLGINAALEEIEKNRGIFYDDAVADACLRLFREKGFKLEISSF